MALVPGGSFNIRPQRVPQPLFSRIVICYTSRRQVVFRCLHHGFLGHVHRYVGILITDTPDTLRGNRDLLAGKPMAGLNDELTNRPIFIIDDKIDDVANFSFAGLDMVAADGAGTPQPRIFADQRLVTYGRISLRQVFSFCYTLLHPALIAFRDSHSRPSRAVAASSIEP
jgi:hypothetical protein